MDTTTATQSPSAPPMTRSRAKGNNVAFMALASKRKQSPRKAAAAAAAAKLRGGKGAKERPLQFTITNAVDYAKVNEESDSDDDGDDVFEDVDKEGPRPAQEVVTNDSAQQIQSEMAETDETQKAISSAIVSSLTGNTGDQEETCDTVFVTSCCLFAVSLVLLAVIDAETLFAVSLVLLAVIGAETLFYVLDKLLGHR